MKPRFQHFRLRERDHHPRLSGAAESVVNSSKFPDKLPEKLSSTAGRLISLCTTCHNRAFQLKQVFEENLQAVLCDSFVEWIILNYNSTDDLDDFITSKLGAADGRIKYMKEISSRPWHCCLAKNIAHKLGTGDILLNLDCDNRVGDALEVIREEFEGPVGILHLWSGRYGDGTFGRIAVRRSLFHAIGGYDQRFYPMAYQDMDLLDRARDLGIQVKQRPCGPGLAILNTDSDSVAHCTVEGMSWEDFQHANRLRSQANRAAGRFVANVGLEWGIGQFASL